MRLNQNRFLTRAGGVAVLLAASGAITGCEQDDAEDTIEEVQDNAEDAADEVGDAVEDTADDVGDAIDDARDG